MAKIKETPYAERPREKLIKKGAGALRDSELLAILLRTGQRNKNVVELARDILRKHKTGLADVSIEELIRTHGLGKVKAAEVVACFELGRRYLKGKRTKIYLKPSDVWKELKDIRNNKKEHFVVLFLDTHKQEVRREVISVGTLTESLAHPREVFEPAIRCSAAAVMVAHNHPSGDPTPSDEDIEITRRLRDAGDILGIDLIDHVIVTNDDYKSFKQEGEL